jgi:DNA invertase Pin-like site-specific DNA recombinase
MLDVRQRTVHQVWETTERTARHSALRERAMALGWETSRIVVIDQDLGPSGASAMDRAGLQRLVAEVGLGQVGLVMGLEVSRLARSSLDWHQFLEIGAMTGTLILDEDGLSDPATFHDRLVLGLKGTMSEAELPVLRARLRGGILHKAERAALNVPVPVGLASAEHDQVVLHPDAQIQQAVRVLLATFKRPGSAWATVTYVREQGLLFPRRVRTGVHNGEIHWMPLGHNAVLKTLRNPRSAGAFCSGRTPPLKHPDGSLHLESIPQEQWPFLVRNAHAGYLSWEEDEANLQQVRATRQAQGEDRRHGPAREGPAVLQGWGSCGRCGNRMTLRSHPRRHGSRLSPEYLCQQERVEEANDLPCQQILGADLDPAMADLLLAQVTPLAIDTSQKVSEEWHTQAAEARR